MASLRDINTYANKYPIYEDDSNYIKVLKSVLNTNINNPAWSLSPNVLGEYYGNFGNKNRDRESIDRYNAAKDNLHNIANASIRDKDINYDDIEPYQLTGNGLPFDDPNRMNFNLTADSRESLIDSLVNDSSNAEKNKKIEDVNSNLYGLYLTSDKAPIHTYDKIRKSPLGGMVYDQPGKRGSVQTKITPLTSAKYMPKPAVGVMSTIKDIYEQAKKNG